MEIIHVSRFEFKYLLNSDEVPEIRKFLLRYCSPDIKADGTEWYGIHTLYLDTPDYAFYRTSTEKAVERLKLRVRSYARDGGPIKLEIKRRVRDVVSKRSILAPNEVWSRIVERGVSCLPREADGAPLPKWH